VVDFRIGQEHAADRRRADVVDLPRCQHLQLLAQVGRGVHEKPRSLAATDRQRRLRTRSRPYTRASGLARSATAVPLREASASGRAENAHTHGAEWEAARAERRGRVGTRLLPAVEVGRDLRTEVEDLELRLDPRHGRYLGEKIGSTAEYAGAIALGAYGLYLLVQAWRTAPKEFESLWALFGLPLPLSLDNVVAGTSLGLVGFSPWLAAAIFGATTALMSFVGLQVGRAAAHFIRIRPDVLTGIALVAVATLAGLGSAR
jgi:hypothetical protein